MAGESERWALMGLMGVDLDAAAARHVELAQARPLATDSEVLDALELELFPASS